MSELTGRALYIKPTNVSSVSTELLSSIYRTAWVTAWADWMDANRGGLGPCNLMDVAPPAPANVKEQMDRWISVLEDRHSLATLWQYFRNKLDVKSFGHYLVMEALGSGVGLWEYAKHNFTIPRLETIVYGENENSLVFDAMF